MVEINLLRTKTAEKTGNASLYLVTSNKLISFIFDSFSFL